MSSEHSDPVPQITPRWTVLTCNVHGSALPDVAALAAAIRAASPDVAVLQEIRKHEAASLASALQMRFARSLEHSPYTKPINDLRSPSGDGPLQPAAGCDAGGLTPGVTVTSSSGPRRVAP